MRHRGSTDRRDGAPRGAAVRRPGGARRAGAAPLRPRRARGRRVPDPAAQPGRRTTTSSTPCTGNPAQERDLGRSGTRDRPVNGGAAMRVRDGAHPGSRHVDPDAAGGPGGHRQRRLEGRHLLRDRRADAARVQRRAAGHDHGLVQADRRRTRTPTPLTPDPNDLFDAVGLAGVLSGDSDGHAVRALLEVIDVSGDAAGRRAGRRVDGASSQTFAAERGLAAAILPDGEWVFLAATFDFDTGHDGAVQERPAARRASTRCPAIRGACSARRSPTSPRRPTRGASRSAAASRRTRASATRATAAWTSLMFLDRAVSRAEIWLQYHWARRP